MRREEARDAEDTPVSEQREYQDDEGRTWVGSVTSGRFEGGEENAEVIFVCKDQPSLPKRFTQLGVPAREVDAYWRRALDGEVRDAFEQSREA